MEVLLVSGVFYNCLAAGYGSLTSHLSLLIGRYVSIDVLESSDSVEVGECVGNGLLVG